MFLGFDEKSLTLTNIVSKYYGEKWYFLKISEVSNEDLYHGTFKILCKSRKVEIRNTKYGNKEIRLVIHLRHEETLRLLDHFGHLNLEFYKFV